MEVLKINNVTKRFGKYIASNNISLSVKKGNIFGLLGPNGAGKTTLIRMICNIFAPDEGDIFLFDQKVNSDTQNRIGYLPEERGLYKKIKVIEQIIYFGTLKGMSRKEAENAAVYWLDKMGATNWKNKKIEELSKGMQQKIQFIATIIHSPDFIILDEPFSGFDPINTELLKSVILELKSIGKTLILSTHIMSQVEELCDEICMINKGKIVLSGNVADIKNSYRKNSIILEYSGTIDFTTFSGIEIISDIDGRAIFKIIDSTFFKQKFIETVNQNADIISFSNETPSMHEIFIDVAANENKQA